MISYVVMDSRLTLRHPERNPDIVDDKWLKDSLSDIDPDEFEGLSLNLDSHLKEEENLDFKAMLLKPKKSLETWSELNLESFYTESMSTNT